MTTIATFLAEGPYMLLVIAVASILAIGILANWIERKRYGRRQKRRHNDRR